MSPTENRKKAVKILSPAMAKNNQLAAQNQRVLDQRGIFAINMIGSPGCGKTTLLEAMANVLGQAMVVIEGDIQTRRDAERIERAGCTAYQIETHGACHLDAQAVSQALDHLDLANGECRILVIENVGNLICPSSYALGEYLKVGLLSVPEGDDKVLKYPSLFSRVSVLVLNKIDLLPYLPFNVDRAMAECRSLNPNVHTFTTSGKTGEGVAAFCQFLEAERRRTLERLTRSSV